MRPRAIRILAANLEELAAIRSVNHHHPTGIKMKRLMRAAHDDVTMAVPVAIEHRHKQAAPAAAEFGTRRVLPYANLQQALHACRWPTPLLEHRATMEGVRTSRCDGENTD